MPFTAIYSESLSHFFHLLPALLTDGAQHFIPSPDVLVQREYLPWLALFHLSRMKRQKGEEDRRNRKEKRGMASPKLPQFAFWRCLSVAWSILVRSLHIGRLVFTGSFIPVFREKQIGVHMVLSLCGLLQLLLLVLGYHTLQWVPHYSSLLSSGFTDTEVEEVGIRELPCSGRLGLQLFRGRSKLGFSLGVQILVICAILLQWLLYGFCIPDRWLPTWWWWSSGPYKRWSW